MVVFGKTRLSSIPPSEVIVSEARPLGCKIEIISPMVVNGQVVLPSGDFYIEHPRGAGIEIYSCRITTTETAPVTIVDVAEKPNDKEQEVKHEDVQCDGDNTDSI